jgi:hypothetical protein
VCPGGLAELLEHVIGYIVDGLANGVLKPREVRTDSQAWLPRRFCRVQASPCVGRELAQNGTFVAAAEISHLSCWMDNLRAGVLVPLLIIDELGMRKIGTCASDAGWKLSPVLARQSDARCHCARDFGHPA